jgi:hypothetical protein
MWWTSSTALPVAAGSGTGDDLEWQVRVRDGWLGRAREIGPGAIFPQNRSIQKRMSNLTDLLCITSRNFRFGLACPHSLLELSTVCTPDSWAALLALPKRSEPPSQRMRNFRTCST